MAHKERRPPGTVVRDWSHLGLRCVVLVGIIGSLNGYVGVPDDHPLYGAGYSTGISALRPMQERIKVATKVLRGIDLDYEDEDPTLEGLITVHGGLTYGGDGVAGLPEENLWWFGFDTCHSGDEGPIADWPGAKPYAPSKHTGDVYRDEEYVAAECERLVKQLTTLRPQRWLKEQQP